MTYLMTPEMKNTIAALNQLLDTAGDPQLMQKYADGLKGGASGEDVLKALNSEIRTLRAALRAMGLRRMRSPNGNSTRGWTLKPVRPR